MSIPESSDSIIRRKTEQGKDPKINLNISKIRNPSIKYSISANKPNNKNIKILLTKKSKMSHHSQQKKKLKHKPIYNQSSSSKLVSYYNPINNKIIDYKNLDSKRYPYELLKTKTEKLFKTNILKINNENNSSKRKSIMINNSTNSSLNEIEKNIKKALNNMKIEIEKKSKEFNSISPKIIRSRQVSSPSLKIFFKKKKIKKKYKNNLHTSLFEEEIVYGAYESLKKLNKKRNKSFDFTEQAKEKILKRLKLKIYKLSNQRLSLISNVSSYENETDDDDEKIYKGFSFIPNSKFIFTFDLLLTIANFCSFVFIPLNIAKNKDIREKEPLINEIFYHLIDFIFLSDLVISFFRGYYNNEMEIIRNNKKIIFHYLQEYFILDFIVAIPLYSTIKIFLRPKNKIYFGELDFKLNLLELFLFIKPFKIIKIIRKKHNKALEDLYTYLSENYYLENLVKFLIYFLIFFLFVHLFVCLHLYLSLQSYPNWITHTNLIDETFLSKYITSLYFMVTTMTTVGYGDIICISPLERIYHIILLVIGTLLYTFLVSKIGNYLRDESHEQIKLSKDLTILEKIRIANPSMSFKLYTKIKSHLLSIFKKRKKTGISLLINGVPDAIKNDLLFKIYSNVINNFTIFKDVKNSNFVHQVLTSFIPITSKKEETIILEGEIIQNIIFVKDGRLSMEIAIDLNDPYKSIQNYIESNFIGISRNEEIKNYQFINKVNSIIQNKNRNYNELKAELDNILLDNIRETNNNLLSNNGISVDLGRMEFSRNEIDKNNNENKQTIKILDIRKNEHYGDIHIFMEQPSPFTIKAKSRIAELLLLRKTDAIIISKSYPNIWRRIRNKSYHNLVSIKNLTFKIIKQYYNTHFYNKNNKEKNIVINLDVSKNSIISNSEFKQSFSQKVKQLNQEKKIIKNNNLKNTIINKNKLFVGYSKKRKNSEDTFGNDLNFSYESFGSNSLQSNNEFKFPNSNSFISNHKNELKKENNNNYYKLNSFNKFNNNKFNKQKTFDNFTFKNDNESINFGISSPKKLNVNRTKSKNSQFKSSKSYKDTSITKNNIESPINRATQYYKINEESFKNNSINNEHITFENFSENLSEKTKKKIKKRKKIQKLKEFLKFQKFKIDKNLLEIYLKQKQNKNNLNEKLHNDIDNNYSYNSSNYTIISQILDSNISGEGNYSTSTRSNPTFNKNSLKITLSESFYIKSSYKNINILTKGEIINNIKYKTFLEKLIKNSLNKNYYNENNINKELISLISLKTKKDKINNNKEEESYNNKFCETVNDTKNDEFFFSEGKLMSVTNTNYKTSIIDQTNHNSNKKFNYNIKPEQTTEIFQSRIYDKKFQKFKNSSKFFEKMKENFEKIKIKDNENQPSNIKNDDIKSNFFKGNLEGKTLYKSKYSINTKKEEINNNNINDENIFSFLNKNSKYNNKDYNYKIEKKFLFINKNNNNSTTKMIIDNNYNENDNKVNNCIIY